MYYYLVIFVIIISMISKYNHKGINWIDLENPNEDEFSHILEQEYIPDIVKLEFNYKKEEDKVIIKDDYIFVCIAGKFTIFSNDNIVISMHNNKVKGLESFSQEIEMNIMEKNEDLKINNNKLLFANLLKNLFIDSQNQLRINEDKIRFLKDKLTLKKKKIKRMKFLIAILIIITIVFICL